MFFLSVSGGKTCSPEVAGKFSGYMELIKKENFTEVVKMFNEKMKTALPEEALSDAVNQLFSSFGKPQNQKKILL